MNSHSANLQDLTGRRLLYDF